MPQISALVRSVPPSGIRRIFELSGTMDDAIKLSVGEPQWEVAPHIREAAARAWVDDFTGYTHNSGILPLREAIVDKLARANVYAVDVDRVHVTAGGSQALHLAMVMTLSPGEEVLIPDPGYSTFAMAPRLVGAVPVPYPLRARDAFMPDIDVLEGLVTPRTRAIVVNSPSNPLGVVYPRTVMQALVDFAARHDLWVISDEVYEALTYDPGFTSAAALDPDRVIGVYSLSKTYALTGGRIGYLVTPSGLAERVRAAQEAIASCVNAPAQVAALAALTGSQDMVAASRAHYLANRDAASALLSARGIPHLHPGGAFYLWIDVSHASRGDVAAWAERFLMEQRVAVAPGSAFGARGEGWVRVCYAGDTAPLLEALGRLPAPGDGEPRADTVREMSHA